jgi:hypothetical protein
MRLTFSAPLAPFLVIDSPKMAVVKFVVAKASGTNIDQPILVYEPQIIQSKALKAAQFQQVSINALT